MQRGHIQRRTKEVSQKALDYLRKEKGSQDLNNFISVFDACYRGLLEAPMTGKEPQSIEEKIKIFRENIGKLDTDPLDGDYDYTKCKKALTEGIKLIRKNEDYFITMYKVCRIAGVGYKDDKEYRAKLKERREELKACMERKEPAR